MERLNSVEELDEQIEAVAQRLLEGQLELDRLLERREELTYGTAVMGEPSCLED